jgi:hypothetical protein
MLAMGEIDVGATESSIPPCCVNRTDRKPGSTRPQRLCRQMARGVATGASACQRLRDGSLGLFELRISRVEIGFDSRDPLLDPRFAIGVGPIHLVPQ